MFSPLRSKELILEHFIFPIEISGKVDFPNANWKMEIFSWHVLINHKVKIAKSSPFGTVNYKHLTEPAKFVQALMLEKTGSWYCTGKKGCVCAWYLFTKVFIWSFYVSGMFISRLCIFKFFVTWCGFKTTKILKIVATIKQKFN